MADAWGRAVDWFWRVEGWIGAVNTTWPDFATTGFLVSYAAAALSFPFFLGVSLYLVWSIAAVGPARKTLSTALIVTFGVPLYPVLTFLVLAILWIILSFATLCFAVVGPIFAFALIWVQLCEFTGDFVAKQREEEVVADDMSCPMIICGFAMGLLSMCTFGVLAAILTLLKSPIVFLACIWHGIRHTIPWLFRETGGWCPLAFFAWCFLFVAGVLALVLAILVSVLTKVVLSAIWPAYIATGWLRFFGAGGRRRDRGCCTPLVEGAKAGYQVLWAADLLTNACIYGDPELLKRTVDEFAEIATGFREELSPECRRIACLPPVIVGLFRGGTWRMAERAVAQSLGVSTDVVREAWRSMREQMVLAGREGIATGLLTRDYVIEVPPELVIGLPARVLLDTIERSPPGELVLASGLRVTADQVPMYGFPKKVWDRLQEARAARSRLRLPNDVRRQLAGALLAGGGDPEELPPGLAQALAQFEALPAPTLDGCEEVRKHLTGIAVECTRHYEFRQQLEKVIKALSGAPQSDAAYGLIMGRPGGAVAPPSHLSGSEDDEDEETDSEDLTP